MKPFSFRWVTSRWKSRCNVKALPWLNWWIASSYAWIFRKSNQHKLFCWFRSCRESGKKTISYWDCHLCKYGPNHLAIQETKVESSSYGSEFIALRIACEMVDALRYKLRMLGVPLKGPARMMCDNASVVYNGSFPESTIKKEKSIHMLPLCTWICGIQEDTANLWTIQIQYRWLIDQSINSQSSKAIDWQCIILIIFCANHCYVN